MTKTNLYTKRPEAPWMQQASLQILLRSHFYPKNTSPQLPLPLIKSEAFSREQTVKYLGVHFNSNLTWSTHIDFVFIKCRKISFFIRRLRSINVHKPLLWRIVSACAIPIILYFAHQSFSIDCLIKTSPLLTIAYVCY